MSNTPVIRVPVEPALRKAAHEFHLANVGEFLLPRSVECFDQLAEAGELWVALEGADVVACCYVTRDKKDKRDDKCRIPLTAAPETDDPPDAEFGGVIVRADRKRQGLGSAIGTVAIATALLHDRPRRVIAHVHVDNDEPRGLLTKRLGFTLVDEPPVGLLKTDIEAALGHSISMKADKDGMIRGNTFEFLWPHLHVFADRLSSQKLANRPVTIQSWYYREDHLAESAELLRELAAGRA